MNILNVSLWGQKILNMESISVPKIYQLMHSGWAQFADKSSIVYDCHKFVHKNGSNTFWLLSMTEIE